MQLQKSFNFQLFKSRSEMLFLQWFLQQCLQQCEPQQCDTLAIERKRDELFIRKLIKLFYWNCKNLTTWTVNLNRLFERSMGRVDIQMSRTNESDRWVEQMSRTDESNARGLVVRTIARGLLERTEQQSLLNKLPTIIERGYWSLIF